MFFDKNENCYSHTRKISKHFFKEVESIMISDGEKERTLEMYQEMYGRTFTEDEWKEEVFKTCLAIQPYMACNSSIREAYMDYSY